MISARGIRSNQMRSLISKKIAVVIPAFNESATIGRLIHEMKPFVHCVIVLDDGSFDDTAIQARNSGARVIRHVSNEGYDRALQKGLTEALNLGADILVTFDADGQHDPRYIRQLSQPIVLGQADLVAGQRSTITCFGEKVFALYTSARFGVRDPLCGLKAYSRHLCQRIGVENMNGSAGTRLLIQSLRLGYKIKFIE